MYGCWIHIVFSNKNKYTYIESLFALNGADSNETSFYSFATTEQIVKGDNYDDINKYYGTSEERDSSLS